MVKEDLNAGMKQGKSLFEAAREARNAPEISAAIVDLETGRELGGATNDSNIMGEFECEANDIIIEATARHAPERSPLQEAIANELDLTGDRFVTIRSIGGQANPMAHYVKQITRPDDPGHACELGKRIIPMLVASMDWPVLLRLACGQRTPQEIRSLSVMGIGAIMEQTLNRGEKPPSLLDDAARAYVCGFLGRDAAPDSDAGLSFADMYFRCGAWPLLLGLAETIGCPMDVIGRATKHCIQTLEDNLAKGSKVPNEVHSHFIRSCGQYFYLGAWEGMGERYLNMCFNHGLQEQIFQVVNGSHFPTSLRKKGELMLLDLAARRMYDGPDMADPVKREMARRVAQGQPIPQGQGQKKLPSPKK